MTDGTALSGMPRPSRRAAEAGFTIIETMLTLATVFISALVLAGASVAIHGQGRLNRDRSIALENVEALLEQMTATPIGALPALFPHGQDVAAFDDLGLKDLRIRIAYDGGDVTARPLRYTVTTTWTGGQGRQSKLVIHGLRMR